MLELDEILVYSLQMQRSSLVSWVSLPGSRWGVRVYLVSLHTVELCMNIGAFVSNSQNKICPRHKGREFTWTHHEDSAPTSWILVSPSLPVLRKMAGSFFFYLPASSTDCLLRESLWWIEIRKPECRPSLWFRKAWAKEIVCLVHKHKDPCLDLQCP